MMVQHHINKIGELLAKTVRSTNLPI